MKLKVFVAVCMLQFFATVASAAMSPKVLVTHMYANETYVWLQFDKDIGAGCVRNDMIRVDKGTELGKSTEAMGMAALMSGKKLRLALSGQCAGEPHGIVQIIFFAN